MYYSFERDEKPTIKISIVGGYNIEGKKIDLAPPGYSQLNRYRAVIEYDFSDAWQEGGHGEWDGDNLRGLAEIVARLIREGIDDAKIVSEYKNLVLQSNVPAESKMCG